MTEEILTMLLLRGYTSEDTSLGSNYYLFTKEDLYINIYINPRSNLIRFVAKVAKNKFISKDCLEELLEELDKYE